MGEKMPQMARNGLHIIEYGHPITFQSGYCQGFWLLSIIDSKVLLLNTQLTYDTKHWAIKLVPN